MKIEELYKLYLKYPQIVTDTRNIIPNSIFFALKGENFNGNFFANQAIDSGAVYAIVDEDIEGKETIIKVNNVLETLQELASYHRNQLDIPVIGITGTNGKTTNKELLNAVLSSKYKVLATSGNFNNHIGVPLTILSINQSHDIAIIEMGANHKGEIAQLCEISKPNYGLVTNVGLAHLEGFGSFQNIIETKADLYKYVKKNNGVNFSLQENSDIIDYLGVEYSFVYYSCTDENVNNYGKGKTNETFISFELLKLEASKIDNLTINTKLIGLYNETNILAAISIANYFKVPVSDIKTSLENYTPSNNRSEQKKTDRNTLILDAYNANPSSVKAAIENISTSSEENKVVILGDMLELGEFSEEKHSEIVNLLQQKFLKKIILVGNEFYKVASNDDTMKYKTVSDLISSGEIQKINKALVLLKGSRGMKLEQIVKYL